MDPLVFLSYLMRSLESSRDYYPEIAVSTLQVLLAIAQFEGISAKDIQSRCQLLRSSASRHLALLNKATSQGKPGLDLIYCVPDPKDGRSHAYYLTSKGKEAVKKILKTD